MAAAIVQPLRVATLGCGSMGTALVKGWLGEPSSDSQTMQLTAYVRAQESSDRLRREVTKHAEPIEIYSQGQVTKTIETAQMVVLGCPPENVKQLLYTPGLAAGMGKKTLVSLVAGLSCAQIKQHLDFNGGSSDTSIVRVIPAIGARSRKSVTLIAVSDESSVEDAEVVQAAFGRLGAIVEVPEALMDHCVGAGAACHALALVAIDTITDACVAEGLPRALGNQLAAHCLASAGGVLSSNYTVEELKASMSTPNGITLRAVLDFERTKARSGIADSVRNAINYSRSMSA